MVSLYQKPGKEILDMSYREYEKHVNSKFSIHQHKAKFKYPIRVGLLGYKQGMTNFFDKWGTIVPCTVVQVSLSRHTRSTGARCYPSKPKKRTGWTRYRWVRENAIWHL